MSQSVARALLLFVLAAFLLTGFQQGWADPTQNQIMKAKLHSSQQILEGLALADYGAVQTHAEKLRLLSQESAWNVLQTADYDSFSKAFRRSAQRLSQAAADKNADAAGLAYVQLTLSCFDCHKHVRAQKLGTGANQ